MCDYVDCNYDTLLHTKISTVSFGVSYIVQNLRYTFCISDSLYVIIYRDDSVTEESMNTTKFIRMNAKSFHTVSSKSTSTLRVYFSQL